MLDFIRIACAVPNIKVGDVAANVESICAYLRDAQEKNVDVLLFPELALTGSTCGDLFYQDTLIRGAREGLKKIIRCASECPGLTVLVGLPVRTGMKLLNCAAVIVGGELKGLVPKQYLADHDG